VLFLQLFFFLSFFFSGRYAVFISGFISAFFGLYGMRGASFLGWEEKNFALGGTQLMDVINDNE